MYRLIAAKDATEASFFDWVHLGSGLTVTPSLDDSMESLTLADSAPSVLAKKGVSESEDWGTWEEEKARELEEALSESLSPPGLIPEDQL
ncbi:hypothetical protein FRC08_016031 [Ceratobasidium sp. 394]|nr:hypothetical protein FRC08_016031 [Ceratobasidium sp. 394]